MAEAQTPANVQAKAGHDPDPTVLTTQALWREIAHSNELENVKITGIEKAIVLARENNEKAVINLKLMLDEKFAAFTQALLGEHNLKEEKFNKVEQRFQLIETTRIEQKQEANSALNTALAAAKDVINEQSKNTIAAAAKSELAFTKQMDQQSELIKSIQSSLDEKINDTKDRLTKIESQNTGAGLPEKLLERISALEMSRSQIQGSGEGGRNLWGYIIGGVGLLATILTIVFLLMRNFAQ